MAHLLHKTGAIRVESLGMAGKTGSTTVRLVLHVQQREGHNHCLSGLMMQMTIVCNIGILTAMGLGFSSDAPHARNGVMCIIASYVLRYKLVMATHYSLQVIERSSFMTAVHMSVDFREAIANRLDQSQTTWSILWHLPRIKVATNDLVIQGRGGEFNVPMSVQSSCTCIETTQAVLE